LPLDQLWQIAVTDSDLPRHIAALNGYLRIVVEADNWSLEKRVELIGRAIPIARRVDEKRQALADLADIPCIDGIRLAMSYYPVEELRPTARMVVGKISQRFHGTSDQHVLESLIALKIYTPGYLISRETAAPAQAPAVPSAK